MTELVLEREVLAYFKRRVEETGGQFRRLEWIGRAHAPDCMVWWPIDERWIEMHGCGGAAPPRGGLAELKHPGADPRPGQDRELTRLGLGGFTVAVLRSFRDVDGFIERFV